MLPLLLVVTTAIGQDDLKGLFSIAIVLNNQVLGEIGEEVQHILVDIGEVLHDATL